MTNYGGYMGKVLLLDLTTRKIEEYKWTDLDREKYIGGKAMASKILYDNLTGTEKAFDPENLIVIATGPLTGTGAPSSNRFDISSLSPLTGITASSNCGGNFGFYLKKAGMDALILRGSCEKLSWVEIDNGEFRFHDASAIQDKKCSDTQEALQRELDELHGKHVRCGMVCIGPAGENLVRYASAVSGERTAGRAGMGAVFGSKKLKAITVSGDKIPKSFDEKRAAEHRKQWVDKIRKHPLTGEQLPRLGTAGLVSSMQVHGLLSTRNYAKGRYEDFEKVSGEALAEELNISNNGCLSCPIRCARRVPVDGKEVKGPELETLGLLGGNIENSDLEKICRWNYELDELGMDTISTAGTIAWAMEANEKGLWENGLRFGETEQLSQIFDDIAHRRGIGAELAEGSRRLSEKYGGQDFAIQSKGMELAAYEPRRAVGQGLGYAVANRGGCHLNAGYLVVLEGLGMNVNGQTPRGKADLCMMMQDMMEAISSGGQCLFTSYGVFPAFMVRNPNGVLQRAVNAAIPFMGPAVRMINKFPELACFNLPLIPYPTEIRYTTGMKLTLGQYIRAGERSYNVERAVNARFGVSAANDTLPKRLTDTPQDPNNPKTKVPLEQMKRTYYRARGWGRDGLPGEKKLRRLGIR